jgi:ferredoxin-NADP reductase
MHLYNDVMKSDRQSAAPRLHPVPRRRPHSLVSPAFFDFWASRVSKTWTWERPLARIVSRQAAAANAVTLVLRPNRHWQGFAAGQHLNVTVEVDGRRLTRSYSLSAPPQADGRLEITVKEVDGGRVSAALCRDAKVGDVLEIGAAFGELALPESPSEPLLFLAAGSGITPMMAMLRALVAQDRRTPVTLLYWARSRDELCFANELRAFAAEREEVTVRFVLTREAAQAADEAEGRIDATHVAPWRTEATHVFACGPDGFVEQARALLADATKSFAAEAFTPPAFVASETGTVTVTLARSGRTLDVQRGQSLLTALEAAGAAPKSGCRMGICNTCACGKRAGTTRHLRTGDTEHEPVSALRVCVNTATTDLVLDL